VLTEAHVLASVGTVAAVPRHFATRSEVAACLASSHQTRTVLAEVDARLAEREAAAMRAVGAWRQVGLRGFAIRADVFRAFGRFDEAYDRFAETALAVRLDGAGCGIRYLEDAVVAHVDSDSLLQLSAAMRTGARGECA